MPGPFDIVWTSPNGQTGGRYALSKEEAAETVRTLSRSTVKTIDALMHGKRFATMVRDADGDMRCTPRLGIHIPTPEPKDFFDLDQFNNHLNALFAKR